MTGEPIANEAGKRDAAEVIVPCKQSVNSREKNESAYNFYSCGLETIIYLKVIMPLSEYLREDRK